MVHSGNSINLRPFGNVCGRKCAKCKTCHTFKNFTEFKRHQANCPGVAAKDEPIDITSYVTGYGRSCLKCREVFFETDEEFKIHYVFCVKKKKDPPCVGVVDGRNCPRCQKITRYSIGGRFRRHFSSCCELRDFMNLE